MQAKLLLVEDDDALRGVLRRGLTEEGFDVLAVATGRELLEYTPRQRPDVLVVDVGLPDSDGRDACQALRSQGVSTPVLFLTARDALADRIAGFQAGGDDYVTKPFDLAEVIVRLRALLRRSGGPPSEQTTRLPPDPPDPSLPRREGTASVT